jgi:hypothetical protein
VLSGLLAAAYCIGVKDGGVIPTLKHLVCNDQEHERVAVSALVTDRALREIYLLPFQLAIRDANPGAVMTSYNKVNGLHSSESPELLSGIVRQEWGFEGAIISDWFVVPLLSLPKSCMEHKLISCNQVRHLQRRRRRKRRPGPRNARPNTLPRASAHARTDIQ